MKITHEDRFTEFELFQMFNVDCDPNIDPSEVRTPYVDGKYEFNDCHCPMWRNVKRELPRGEKNAVQDEDNIKPGISQHKPGSQRVADLAKFYAENANEEKSAFFV